MELVECFLPNTPVGIIQDIKNLIELVADDITVKYRNAESFGFSLEEPATTDTYVDMLCLFYIEEDIRNSFIDFLEKYQMKRRIEVKNLNLIYNQGAAANDDSK